MAGVYGAVATFRKPLIACVNGIAYGGGALVAIMCDVRVASDTAAFRFPGAAYGLVVGGSQLPRLIGPAYAKELLFTARVVRAEEALRIGLVNAVVPHAEVFEAALEMARLMAANSPATLDRDEGGRRPRDAGRRRPARGGGVEPRPAHVAGAPRAVPRGGGARRQARGPGRNWNSDVGG